MNTIKQLRSKNNLSQRKLSKILNVTKGTISKWEHGINSPSPHFQKLLCNALNTNVDTLLGRQIIINDKSKIEQFIKLYFKEDKDIFLDLLRTNNVVLKVMIDNNSMDNLWTK